MEDKNLKSLSLDIATGLRLIAEAKRVMAPFADIERTITSANDRSSAHQESVIQMTEANRYYAGTLRAVESYCEGNTFSLIHSNEQT